MLISAIRVGQKLFARFSGKKTIFLLKVRFHAGDFVILISFLTLDFINFSRLEQTWYSTVIVNEFLVAHKVIKVT